MKLSKFSLRSLALLCGVLFLFATHYVQGRVTNLDTSRAATFPQDLKVYKWTGHAKVVKKNGKPIPVDAEGTVTAPNFQLANAYSDNAFRAGYVERKRELGEGVIDYLVTVTPK